MFLNFFLFQKLAILQYPRFVICWPANGIRLEFVCLHCREVERIFTGNMESGNIGREYLHGIWGVVILGENIYREYGEW